MSLPLYIIGWILILFFIIGITLVAFFGRRIDQCRTWKVLYCYADSNSGWRCSDPNSTTEVTLAKTLSDVADKTQLIPCPSNADIPGTGSTGPEYASYVLAPNPAAFCNLAVSDASRPIGCRSSGPLGEMINFPGNPLTVPANMKVSALDVKNWFCDPSRAPNQDTSAKTLLWRRFIDLNPDFQLSQPVVFRGQTGP